VFQAVNASAAHVTLQSSGFDDYSIEAFAKDAIGNASVPARRHFTVYRDPQTADVACRLADHRNSLRGMATFISPGDPAYLRTLSSLTSKVDRGLGWMARGSLGPAQRQFARAASMVLRLARKVSAAERRGAISGAIVSAFIDVAEPFRVELDELSSPAPTTTTTTLPACHGVVCTALDQCHATGTCDPSTGACSNPSVADGTSCDDSNPATYVDACTNGVCSGVDCPCDGEVFPGPTGDPTWGPSFRAQTCSSSAPSSGEVVALPAPCFGHSEGQYLGHLYVARSIDGQGVYECGAYTTQGFPSAFDCSFDPPTTSITASQAQACLLSLQAIAANRGVSCPF
jgi:hypothetical protein